MRRMRTRRLQRLREIRTRICIIRRRPQLLQRGGHFGDLDEVFQALVFARAFAEGPEVGEDVVRDSAALV